MNATMSATVGAKLGAEAGAFEGPATDAAPLFSVSVVSHRHGALLPGLLQDLARLDGGRLEVLLTLNVPEDPGFAPDIPGLRLAITHNAAPRGFGANHNAAFARSTGRHFCVLNPDIRLSEDPFEPMRALLQDTGVGTCAPLVRAPDGSIEDSARRFPTLARLAARALGGERKPDYAASGVFEPDWIAGMFMAFRRETYREVGGFDERYFLYYEDVDLCARLRAAGYRVKVDAEVGIVHAARRSSHRSLRFALWHASSMARFLLTSPRR